MREIAEADWKTPRALSRIALDRYCARVLDECAGVIGNQLKLSHERYLQLFKLISRPGRQHFGRLQSQAAYRLAHILALGVLTDDELDRFSPELRDTMSFLTSGSPR